MHSWAQRPPFCRVCCLWMVVRSTRVYHWDLTPGRVNKRGFSVRYPGLAVCPSGAKEDLQSLVISAQANGALICRFQIGKNQSPRMPDEVIENRTCLGSSSRNETDLPNRDPYVVFWDYTHRLPPWVSFPVAVVSTSSGQNPTAHRVVELLGWAVRNISNRRGQAQISGHIGSKRRR
ncbi:hypothetical protein C8Q69DRAFT_109149 [Paecilomyces variotii]|uniref:Uncharacterized protein n=1 Tax=Byssochlamys spectabilis TaxID=264951 RepID=A0A443HJA1_BYSSP|nr:hypothetical protein C8Q69DRAFT_109149 [Paecilomyces variotii]RWQ91865.1 hypothetical protein C8Q69DRAFT_109149 [Paecilomyces variotii]